MNTSEIIPLVRAFSKAPTDAQVTTAVDAWLDDHPEATTTVEDGAITKAKLDSTLQEVVDEVPDLRTDVDKQLELLTYDPVTLDTSSNNYSRFIPSSTNKWTGGNNAACSIFKIPEHQTSVKVKANSSKSAGIAFLKTNDRTVNTKPDYATGWSAVDWISAGSEKEYAIPSDASYLFVAKTYNSVTYTPDYVELIEMFDAEVFAQSVDATYAKKLGLHEVPASETALNIVKRCRQMTDIKWTPAVDLKRFMLVQRGGVSIPGTANAQNYLGTFKAGVEYTGIPYGRATQTMNAYGMDFATVGNYVGFETFISSVCNENSKLCKTDVGSVSDHTSVIYATVCSGMTCYALNIPEVPTANIGSISGLSLIGNVNNSGTLLADNRFKIGDVLNLSGYHTAIITDIIRDADGLIQFVEISDASTAGLADKNFADGQIGGVCRRKGWSRAQLFDADSWGAYSLYRYNVTVTYTPSPYVNVGDEFDAQRVEHFPCMPYEGNKFTYKTGYIPNNAVKILVSPNLGYSYLKVFKDGTEITGSPFTVTSETTSIDVTEISAGTYTAYLCNISDGDVTNLTYACEWTITA